MDKVIDAGRISALIKTGDILFVNGAGPQANPDLFFATLEKRFLDTGSPHSLTYISSGGSGGRTENTFANRLHHPGLVSRLIIGHLDSVRLYNPNIIANRMEAYNLPQGILSAMLHNAVAHRPWVISKIGLHTFLDPRQHGCGLNDISKEELIRFMELDGEEYLLYKTIYPTVAVVRGTTADPAGNITMEKEAVFIDPLATALAAKNNGGKVIVQVERLSAIPAKQSDIRIPGKFVDYIFLDPDQWQTGIGKYNPYFSGELKIPKPLLHQHILTSIDELSKGANKRRDGDRLIARRAAQELRDGDLINLGIGIAMMIGLEAYDMGIFNDSMKFTVENGPLGGIPAGDQAFGAMYNADAVYDQTSQFELYEGQGLDFTGVGALEIDQSGNVNVFRTGDKIFGVGGSNHTMLARKVVVCAKFQVGSGCHQENGHIVYTDGSANRFVPNVEYICLSAGIAQKNGQKIIYVTERGVFVLGKKGLILTEIGRDIDLEKQILSRLPFPVEVSQNLKTMAPLCYEFLNPNNQIKNSTKDI
jgi:propionate CoA-transferase